MQRPEIVRDADLASLSTFRLPARAAELVVIRHPEQLAALPPAERGELVLGGGSNTVFLADYPGRVLLNRLRGIHFENSGDDVLVTAAAGEDWHGLVRACLDRGLFGLENLILIPGSVGAAPMQNIGAYGVELADVFDQLQAWDRETGTLTEMNREACRFGYRDSRFKSSDLGRFLITAVTLRLSRTFRPRIEYRSLAQHLNQRSIDQPGPRQLAAAVMRLRRHRLPDPARLPNAGSFFKNPIVDAAMAQALESDHPGLPQWVQPDGRVKIAAGHLIEQLGWKGRSIGDAGVYEHHALVLVNRGQARAQDLQRLIGEIMDSVVKKFGLDLEPEPALVGLDDLRGSG